MWFFFGTWFFFFLINLGDWFFVIVICHFFVLIGLSLIRVYEKIYLISFFPSFYFFTSNQTKMREIKIFSTLLLFSILTFSPFQQNEHVSLRDFKSHCLNQKEIWKEKWEYEKSSRWSISVYLRRLFLLTYFTIQLIFVTIHESHYTF